MCGIVGFTGKSNSEILEKMTNSIHHRGPDDDAYIVNKNFSIGYRRLSIIDLSTNIYPIRSEDYGVELVLNGEIYNYVELREQLKNLGHQFATASDSEVIVHGYEEWGRSVVEKLRGMFVFVLYDKKKNELFIARDRLGIKPLYYARVKNRIVFSSEIKALFKSFGVSKDPDEKSVFRFLHHRLHDTDENTFFKDIKRLLPGHFMILKHKNDFTEVELTKYWNPEYNPEFTSTKSDDEYAKEFKDIFEESVNLHLIADVPVGVTLSGGLDSSGITSLSKKLYEQNYSDKEHEIIAFSAVHPGESVDESEYIDEVVKATGIKSVKIQPQVDNFWEELENWVYFQEEPVISAAPYAYYTVMREARKKVTVLLSGQGGDELLAGYIPYFMSYIHSALDQKKYWSLLRETWMGRDLYFPYYMKLRKKRANTQNLLNPNRVLDKDFLKEYKHIHTEAVPSRNLNERLFNDVLSYTTPSLLRYEDKNSMAHSLESRVPYLDHKVVEYIFNLPIDQKIKFGWNRFIYRNAMKGIIPEKNRLRRSKVGFTTPEWGWIEKRADKFRSIFNSTQFVNRAFWNAEKVQSEFESALKKEKTGDVLLFWRLFIVEMWMRRFVD